MILLILLLIELIYSTQPCIYPSFYWINNNFYKNGKSWPLIEQNQYIKTEDFTQCGVSWPDLLDIDFTQVKERNLLWLLLFQQYSISSLNRGILKQFFDNISPEKLLYYDEDLIRNIQNELYNNEM